MAKWEKGALNEVSIEGILSEVKLQEGTGKNNEPVIFGEYKIKTTNTIDGIETVCEIPIRVYQSKITKNNKENPAYNTALTIMKDYVSIAAGGEEKATCRVGKAHERDASGQHDAGNARPVLQHA